MIRFFDIIISLLGLLVLSPLFIIIFLIIIIDSKGGGFYLQSRVGLNNIDFKLIKFRSMKLNSDKGSLITIGSKDSRITRIGVFIRKFKLDELPQLINVFLGQMSFVGPRPEVRKYVDLYTNEQLLVLSVRPGITDYASIIFADENKILGESENPEKMYIEEIMPQKIALNMKYINNNNVFEYFKIIILTVFKIFKFK